MESLKTLREEAGYMSQREAAEAFGVNERTWRRYEKGGRVPKAVVDQLRMRARGWATGAVRVPVEGRVKAGAATVQFGVEMGSVEVVPRVQGEPLFAVEVEGHSMAPEIRSGDVLVCRRVDYDVLDSGDIVIADLGAGSEAEYVVKRLRYRMGVPVLESVADGFPPIEGPFRVHAKVIEIRRPLERR